MNSSLFVLFLELSKDITEMKQQKYQHLRAYYQKHFGKDTFRQNYYDELKFDFERLERLDEFFDLLGETPLLFAIADHLRTAKRKKQQNNLPIEYVQVWIPLVPEVKNLGNYYFINLLKKEGVSDE